MSFAPGTRLGPYEIVALIGRGGMGEVYRARDTRLHREVALKVLPPAVAANPTRRARFEREAQAISQLNHPHICSIFDVGTSDDIAYLVMELIEGDTLEHPLRFGPLPWSRALPLAIQIASALEAAHRRGIVHRDLKPANIMLAESGVKLVDFGLAKWLDQGSAPGHAEVPPTDTLTAERSVIGTLHYMSPEQLEGRDVDARTDVFAFGVTLYEMVTGRKAFDGRSAASVTAAILTADPPPLTMLTTNDPLTPPMLDHLVRRAVAKNPEDRWQSARDLLLELRWIQEGRSSAGPARSLPGRRWIGVTLAAAGALGIVVFGVLYGLRQPVAEPEEPLMFTIAAPSGTQFHSGHGRMSVAADSRHIAFVAGADSNSMRLWWQSLDSTVARPLIGTEEAIGPFWSPDGKSIGFFSGGALKRVSILNGVVSVVTRDVGNAASGFWSPDETIVFARDQQLVRVPASGGTPTPLGVSGTLPAPMPNGGLLFVGAPTSADRSLHAGTADVDDAVTLPIQSNAVFAADRLVYRQGQSLVARSFDPQTLEFTGPPIPLADNVSFNPANGRTDFDAARDLLIYQTEVPLQLVWRDRQGVAGARVGEVGLDWNPVVAREGPSRVAVDRFDPSANTFHLWSVGDRGEARPITRGQRERFPLWSRDGQWVFYWFAGTETTEIRRIRSDGTGPEETMIAGQGWLVPLDQSADGQVLVYGAGDAPDLFALNIADRTSEPLTRTPEVREITARLSPDMKWLAYAPRLGPESDIWVQPYPGAGPSRRLTTGGGLDPSWRADGKEIFYVTPSGALMAVPVSGPQLSAGSPVRLFSFETGPLATPLHLYAASADGQRFLVNERNPEPEVIRVIVHWRAMLK